MAVPVIAIVGILMAAYAAHKGQKEPRGSASRRSYNYMFWGGVGSAFVAPVGAAGAAKGTAATGAVNYASKVSGAAPAAAGTAQSAPAVASTAGGDAAFYSAQAAPYQVQGVQAVEPATQSTVQTGPGFWDSMTRNPQYYGQAPQQTQQSPYTRMLQQGFGGQPQAVEQPTPQPPPRREQRPYEEMYHQRESSVAAGEEPAGRHGAARWGADFWWS